MVADIKREIIKAYSIEHLEAGVALRGSLFIDQDGIVHHQIVNDLMMGRNIDEIMRMVDVPQFHEEHGEGLPGTTGKGRKGWGFTGRCRQISV
ncbi:MAG: Alkyl hydroperoxide reductase C [Sodalis sp.]|nr:MAG: Alkyl hydroperoxide reductase C [Sodalis sp.]